MSCYIRTYTGRDFDIFNPTSDSIDIRDIARALSVKPRFSGMTKKFLSVAQHCVYCSMFDAGDEQLALDNLLHECGEAYLADVPTQVKQLWTGFKECEDRILSACLMKFCGRDRYRDPFWLHTVDRRMRTTEAFQWMNGSNEWYQNFPDPAYDIIIDPVSHEVAEALFLTRFEQLAGVTV